MTVPQVLKELRARATLRGLPARCPAQAVAPASAGVGLRDLRELARRLGRDHRLALKLWDSGIHDARRLATLVEVPGQATDAQLDRWVLTAGSAELADSVCARVVLASPLARAKVGDWCGHPQELARRTAYVLLAALARSDAGMTDADFAPHVDAIPSLIHREGPLVADAMRRALIDMGGRNDRLRARVAGAAARIRRVTSGLIVIDGDLGAAHDGRPEATRLAG